jgi:hypothetical protein
MEVDRLDLEQKSEVKDRRFNQGFDNLSFSLCISEVRDTVPRGEEGRRRAEAICRARLKW